MQYRKIAVIGGGSFYWTPRTVCQMACSASTRQAEIVLLDAMPDRAAQVADICGRVVARAYPEANLTVRAANELADAIDAADVVFTTYRNGGHDSETRINEISRKYGSKQNCYTAGPGAMIYLAVQGPPLIDLVRAMADRCPRAWLINCINPLPAVCMLAARAGHDPRRVLGFCGAIHWTRRSLAGLLDVAQDRLDYRMAGTNHCTFYPEILVDGEDAYPAIREKFATDPYFDIGIWGCSTLPAELLKLTGALCEPGHADDIFPNVPFEHLPPTAEAQASQQAQAKVEYGQDFPKILDAYANGQDVAWQPPTEPDVAVTWLDALAGEGDQRRFSINYVNDGAVSNLPDWTVLDLECYLDRRGVTPLSCPPLPEIVAEVVRRHQVTFEMGARAVLARDPKLLSEAIRLCPFGDYMTQSEHILADAREAFGSELIFS